MCGLGSILQEWDERALWGWWSLTRHNSAVKEHLNSLNVAVEEEKRGTQSFSYRLFALSVWCFSQRGPRTTAINTEGRFILWLRTTGARVPIDWAVNSDGASASVFTVHDRVSARVATFGPAVLFTHGQSCESSAAGGSVSVCVHIFPQL